MSELTNTTGTEVSTDLAMGIAGEISNDDVLQGRLYVMQALSTFVKEEKCRQGGIVTSTDLEEVAYKGNKDEDAKPLEFMVCGIVKYWVVKDADTKEFIEKFPANNQNELPWEETVNGRNIKRIYTFSYMVLLKEELEQGIEMPYELAFRSTGVGETKKLNSLIQRLANKGISSHKKIFKADIVERTNNNNESWWGLDLGISHDASDDMAAKCEEYHRNFSIYKEAMMSRNEDGETQEAAPAKNTQANMDDY